MTCTKSHATCITFTHPPEESLDPFFELRKRLEGFLTEKNIVPIRRVATSARDLILILKDNDAAIVAEWVEKQ